MASGVPSGEKRTHFSWLCQGWTQGLPELLLYSVWTHHRVVSSGTFTPEQCLSCHLPFPSSSYGPFLKTGWTQQVSGPQKFGVQMVSLGSLVSFPYPCPVDHSPHPSLIVFQIVVVLSYFRPSFPLAFLTFECLFLLQSPPRAVFSDQPPWRSASSCFFFILPHPHPNWQAQFLYRI